MAMPIDFDKEMAEYLLDCLDNSRPIEGIRTKKDYLALAGACFFATLSLGPITKNPVEWQDLTDEQKEHVDEASASDIHAAIEFYGHLTMLVRDGEYDAAFEPHFTAIVEHGDHGREVWPISGCRTQD